MGGLTPFQLLAAGVHSLPALVWAIVAQNSWRLRRTRRPHSRFFRMLPVVGTAVAVSYSQFTLICLVPAELLEQHPVGAATLYTINDCIIFSVVALARHMSYYFPTPERTPSRTWLGVNYGMSLLMSGLGVLSLGALSLPITHQQIRLYLIARVAYQVVMLGMVLVQVVRLARPGGWNMWSGVWLPRRADALFLGGGVLSLASWLVVAALSGWPERLKIWQPTPSNLVFDTLAGIGFVAPLAVRILGEVVRGVLMMALMLVAIALLSYGIGVVRALPAAAELGQLLDLATVVALALLLVPGHAWLRGQLDGLLFQRRQRRREELQAFLHTLSPELGVDECCRRAMAELSLVMRLRGVAILLHDEQRFAHGGIAIEPIANLWLRNPVVERLPTHALVGYELRELPASLQEAIGDAGIVGVTPIVSQRQRWGYLFISTGLLAATFSVEDVQTIEAFADQLALILDGVGLLGRVVAIERALAHREKLAAIGELAARIAHEIRNPVTAARSLAQQLAEEPTSPLNAEHAGLILSELERVERQVAALLRFARREEFQFEPVDLGELAHTTIEALRPRLETAGITVQLDANSGVIARADREKLRQVLINLIENARDALADATEGRQLSLVISRKNGAAALQLRDTGPGVPADALPRLFEPFFSLKPQGTGLGLAIAQRTLEAHGGCITATCESNGMTFVVELPLAEHPA